MGADAAVVRQHQAGVGHGQLEERGDAPSESGCHVDLTGRGHSLEPQGGKGEDENGAPREQAPMALTVQRDVARQAPTTKDCGRHHRHVPRVAPTSSRCISISPTKKSPASAAKVTDEKSVLPMKVASAKAAFAIEIWASVNAVQLSNDAALNRAGPLKTVLLNTAPRIPSRRHLETSPPRRKPRPRTCTT